MRLPISCRAAALIIVAMVAVRLVVAAFIPLGPDEAYYFDWSRFPSWGYYDHPPMGAWWIALGTWVVRTQSVRHPGGRHPRRHCRSRSPSILTGARPVRSGDRHPRRAVDERHLPHRRRQHPCHARCAERPVLGGRHPRASRCWSRTGKGAWWLLVGLARRSRRPLQAHRPVPRPGDPAPLVVRRDFRKWILSPWPWAGAALALGGDRARMLLWNAAHDWVTLTKQFGRLTHSGFQPLGPLAFAATQFGILNPLVAIFAGLGLRSSPAPPRRCHVPTASRCSFGRPCRSSPIWRPRLPGADPGPLAGAYLPDPRAGRRRGRRRCRAGLETARRACPAGRYRRHGRSAFVAGLNPGNLLPPQLDVGQVIRGWGRFQRRSRALAQAVRRGVDRHRPTTAPMASLPTTSPPSTVPVDRDQRTRALRLCAAARSGAARQAGVDPHPRFRPAGQMLRQS